MPASVFSKASPNLSDGNGAGHDTLGIERSVTTTAGASYTLSIDYAVSVFSAPS